MVAENRILDLVGTVRLRAGPSGAAALSASQSVKASAHPSHTRSTQPSGAISHDGLGWPRDPYHRITKYAALTPL